MGLFMGGYVVFGDFIGFFSFSDCNGDLFCFFWGC